MNIQKRIAAIERHAPGSTLTYFHKHIIHRIRLGCRTPFDLAMLNQAYIQVKESTYHKLKNCHFGVEHITQDGEGYIYYKGEYIDHFSYESKEWLEEWQATRTAANICKLLEKKGHPINQCSFVYRINQYLTPQELAACENVHAEIIKYLDPRLTSLKNKKLLNRLKSQAHKTR
jgi:hypothetical protein